MSLILSEKDRAELFRQAQPPEIAKWPQLLGYVEGFRAIHRSIERSEFDWPPANGNRSAILRSLTARTFAECLAPPRIQEPDVLELEENLPCPFCPPFSLPLNTLIPEIQPSM
jgi:hypothetical protein